RMSAPYQAIRCADGFITIGGANDRLFRRLSEVLGHPEWVSDPAFADNTVRVRNRTALAARIEQVTGNLPRADVLALLERHEIPCGPINNYAEVFEDPQIVARHMVVRTEHPVLGSIRALGSPIKMSATPP